MADGASIDFRELLQVVGIYHRRAEEIPSELAPAIADAMVAEVLEVFETEGYGEWPDYAESTLNRKLFGKRKHTSPKLLQDTGNLAGSITPAHDEEAAEAFTNVPYARYHTSRAPRRKVPLRDFFAIDEEMFLADVADMVLLHLDRPMAAE